MSGTGTTRADRREELLDAVDAVIREEGPDASMEALAAGAGITKPVLYRHFGDKQGLLAAHAQRVAAELAAEITTELARRRTPRSRIRTTIDTYLAALERAPRTYWFVARRSAGDGNDVHAAMREVVDRITAAVALALAEELAAAGVPTDAAPTWARALVGMVQLVGDRWLAEQDVPREVVVDRLTDLVWLGFRGLGAR
ncbi:MAG: TetR/AcrR family transcriptional regulator [Actinomycetes bacterium]